MGLLDLNWLAVIIATVGYQALGALWYGPLFGRTWMDAMGHERPDHGEEQNPGAGYALTALGALVATVTLGIILQWVQAAGWLTGLYVGAVVGVGFVATTGLQAVPFEDRPPTVYILNAGYNVLALALVGALLGAWP